jgi:stage III sporulation protein AE
MLSKHNKGMIDKMLTKNKRHFELKILIAFIVFLIMQVFFPITVFADQNNTQDIIINEQVKSNEIEKLQEQLKKNSNDGIKELLPGYDPEKIISDTAKGKFDFNPSTIFNNALKFLFKEIYFNLNLLIKLIVLSVFCSILKNLQASFLNEGVGEIAFYACYTVVVTILIISLNSALKMSQDMIDSMVTFMQVSIPVLITLLISGGNIASGSVFQPILIMIVEICATIMKNVFIPLVFLSTILSIVDNISEKIQISKLAAFIKQLSTWALGLILTVFIAIITIQGSIGAVVDGVASKTAKFAIGAFIPVAGKYLADAADTVIGCALLIKNAAGLAVMIGIIGICIVPLLKIFALILLYKITCVLVEPISEKRITNCVNEVAKSMTFIIGITASVVFMFLISVTAIISSANISAMMR